MVYVKKWEVEYTYSDVNIAKDNVDFSSESN